MAALIAITIERNATVSSTRASSTTAPIRYGIRWEIRSVKST